MELLVPVFGLAVYFLLHLVLLLVVLVVRIVSRPHKTVLMGRFRTNNAVLLVERAGLAEGPVDEPGACDHVLHAVFLDLLHISLVPEHLADVVHLRNVFFASLLKLLVVFY